MKKYQVFQKISAYVPEVRAIEDFWSFFKDKVYENKWNARNLTELRNVSEK